MRTSAQSQSASVFSSDPGSGCCRTQHPAPSPDGLPHHDPHRGTPCHGAEAAARPAGAGHQPAQLLRQACVQPRMLPWCISTPPPRMLCTADCCRTLSTQPCLYDCLSLRLCTNIAASLPSSAHVTPSLQPACTLPAPIIKNTPFRDTHTKYHMHKRTRMHYHIHSGTTRSTFTWLSACQWWICPLWSSLVYSSACGEALCSTWAVRATDVPTLTTSAPSDCLDALP